jgi:hypothetical protein
MAKEISVQDLVALVEENDAARAELAAAQSKFKAWVKERTVTLQQIADEIVKNPKLRVLFIAQNFPRAAERFLQSVCEKLPDGLLESVTRVRLCVAGWDKINPTLTVTRQCGAVAGLRSDLIVVEGDSLPRGFDERFRCRLTINGRVEFFSWDGERR